MTVIIIERTLREPSGSQDLPCEVSHVPLVRATLEVDMGGVLEFYSKVGHRLGSPMQPTELQLVVPVLQQMVLLADCDHRPHNRVDPFAYSHRYRGGCLCGVFRHLLRFVHLLLGVTANPDAQLHGLVPIGKDGALGPNRPCGSK
ncbi:MAG: hypothetical protein GY722_17480 [bacterium]|nr:hypothetical protein [bacterium]